jgi:hypothetical protein
VKDALAMVKVAESVAVYGQEVVTVDRRSLSLVLAVADALLARRSALELWNASVGVHRHKAWGEFVRADASLDAAVAALRGTA